MPAVLFIIALLGIYLWNDETIYQSQVLLTALNVLFCSSVSLLVAYLAARSYRATGSLAVLLLGCGTTIFALINLLAGILLTDTNDALTVYNTGVCLSGLCFAGSAVAATLSKPVEKQSPGNVNTLIIAYVCVALVVILLTIGTIAGLTPAFFELGQGFTPLRQVIMYTTVITFVAASGCFGFLYRRSHTPFLLLYSIGLLLIGIGVMSLSVVSNIWEPLGWMGRAGQYLGALYMLLAVLNLSRGGDDRLPLERALRETEEKYRRIVETAREGIWTIDDQGKTTYVNYRMAEMLGTTREELLNKGVSAFTDEEGLALAQKNLERRKQGIRESHEYKFIRKDGTALWAIVSSTPMLDREGRFLGSMSMITDITERKLAETALEQSRQRLNDIVSSIQDGFFEIDRDWRFTYINRRASINGGFEPEELIGKCIWDVFPYMVGTRFETVYRRVMETRQAEHFEIDSPARGVWYGVNVYPSAAGITGYWRDITGRKRAEEALKASQASLARAQEIAHMGSWEWNLATNEVTGSGELYRMFGLKPDPTTFFQQYIELLVPEDKQRVLDALNDTIEKNVPYNIDYHVVLRNGTDRYFHAEAVVANDNGKPARVFGIVLDITERKRAEEALLESQSRLETVFTSIPDAIMEYDANGKLVRANETALKAYGLRSADLSREKAVGKLQITHMDGRPVKVEELPTSRALKGNIVAGELYRFTNAEWRELIIMTYAAPLFKDGKISGAVATWHDITEQKRAEEALRDSEQRFATAFYASPAASCITRLDDGYIVDVNENYQRMFGFSREELLGRTTTELGIYGTDTASRDQLVALFKKNGRVHDYESSFMRKDNKTVSAIFSIEPIRIKGQPHIITTIVDITERKRAEEALLEAKSQAELYLDLMGHDISNMHQIALGQLELAQEILETDSRLEISDKELVDTSINTLKRSAKLIENIRNIQKMWSGEYKFERMDLCDILDEAVKSYSKLPGKDIIIDCARMPGCHVLANQLLRDVFNNLVDNAVKHCEDPIRINISVTPVGQNGSSMYQVVVEDNGHGVPDEKKAEIFNRLKRGQTKARGTGLGLYIVKTLVEGFGGSVRVEDRVPGDHTKGAKFVVMLLATGK